MFLNTNWFCTELLCRRPRLVLITLPGVLILMLYLISVSNTYLDGLRYPPFRSYNASAGEQVHLVFGQVPCINQEMVDGFLVWNSKCHMIAMDPLDPSIVRYVKRVKFEACTKTPLLTEIVRTSNGSSILSVDPEAARSHSGLVCCWAPVHRPKPEKNLDPKIDWKVSVENCTDFKDKLIVPQHVEVVLVKCRANVKDKRKRNKFPEVYTNVHPILGFEKVRDRLDQKNTSFNESRKLSVLILGIDNVSRLNFERTMPRTMSHLRDTGWIELKGYNKMGDNTFPNLMAILTGFSNEESWDTCLPTKPYGMDNCPLLWYAFRNAGYITAYGEDWIQIGTFNYQKVGFVDPPTDYYLRPYMLAGERLLPTKSKFGAPYCTGPEISMERIFNFAADFAKAFEGLPYFGFFWTNSISHENMNAPSSMDGRIRQKFEKLELDGVLNDSMVIFLSDHGMRYGAVRETLAGWYEERLPFIYIWLPEWFRAKNHEAHESLQVNSYRLTTPYDLYETLRDVLTRAGGEAKSSTGCPKCQSLLRPVPRERGCDDVGVAPHWCTCSALKPGNLIDKVGLQAAQKFVDHMENVVRNYRNAKGKRLCAELKLKKLIRVYEIVDVSNGTSGSKGYFCWLSVTPGDAKFEVTVRYYGNGNFTVSDDEVSRTNSYANSAKCLERGQKRYCHCQK